MNKKWLIAGGITAAVAVGAALYSESLFALAARRKSTLFDIGQKLQMKLVSPPPDRAKEVAESVIALKNKPLEIVKVKSHDGLMLVGHWYPAENPQRTVVMFHGWRSSWYNDFGMSVEFLHDNGCNLLLIEQRSHGSSEGQFISYGVLERYDVQTWVDFAVGRNPDNLPIFLCGISMGASTVLMATELPLKNTVSGIIADCGFTSGEEVLKDTMAQNFRHMPAKAVLTLTNKALKHHTGCGYGDYSTITSLKECRIPILFIHGDKDELVPVSMTYENYEACSGPKELFIVPGAGHGMSYLIDTEGYQQKVLDFFNKYEKQAQ